MLILLKTLLVLAHLLWFSILLRWFVFKQQEAIFIKHRWLFYLFSIVLGAATMLLVLFDVWLFTD